MENHIPSFLMLLLALAIAPAVRAQDVAPMTALVETERLFSRTSVENGIRSSFLSFFAEDGIVFQPGPVVYKDVVKNRPAPSNPKGVTLQWEPVWGDVARAGDIGYTTGPYRLTDNASQPGPPQYGVFFSVWKKQADGNWRVALDVGMQTPEPWGGASVFTQAPRATVQSAGRPSVTPETLQQAEEAFFRLVASDGDTAAYAHYAAETARLHREGHLPIIGKRDIREYLSDLSGYTMGVPLHVDVAQSDDLGYVYGSYEHTGIVSGASRQEAGYYARVWKKDAQGRWRIVMDVAHALPTENH